MVTLYLLTGSNMGKSIDNLDTARHHINRVIGTIISSSSVYKSEPWGNKEQQDFLNQVLEVRTPLKPEEVMNSILSIEKEMGRNRKMKWEPRIIDIDILFYGDAVIEKSDLVIPHPLLHERRFTLAPLDELAPSWVHPVVKKTVAQLLQECTDSGLVEKLSV